MENAGNQDQPVKTKTSEVEGRARRPRRAESAESQTRESPKVGRGVPAEPRALEAPHDLEQRILPARKVIGHEVPAWVSQGSTYFIAVCANNRAARSLMQSNAATLLIESVKFLHRRGDWFARLFLVMPDHVHGLFSFPADTSLAHRIAAWKGYTRKTYGIDWQERFFDHRLRSDESLEEKASYIRMNPVRAGLTESPELWPYLVDAFAVDGSAGTPRPT